MTIKQFWLTKLAEECTEVGQRALKSQQFGALQVWKAGEVPGSPEVVPDEGLNNAQRLRGELNDLMAIVDVLEMMGEISPQNDHEYNAARDMKINKIYKYLVMSQDLGLVEKA